MSNNDHTFYPPWSDPMVIDIYVRHRGLQIDCANQHLPKTKLDGYYSYSSHGHEYCVTPVIARVPGGSGYWAGWTMGRGNKGLLDGTVHEAAETAARAAHSMARLYAAQCDEINDNCVLLKGTKND